MIENTKAKYKSISPQDIADLKAIYEDYLYMVRQHEFALSQENVDQMSIKQVLYMNPEYANPANFIIPWSVEKLNEDEKQEFAAYAANNIKGDGKKTYVFLKHVRSEEDNGEAPFFAISPYKSMGIDMQLPSMIENYKLHYTEEATFGNTEFHVDGRYKVIYHGDKVKDKLVGDCINDPDLGTEITVMLNLGECYRQNGYVDDNKFGRMAVNVYASELLGTNENNLLEILSSFAEKVKNICYARYHEKEGVDNIKRAQKEGFLNLPDNFQDYVNIRNFMRHQWDTLYDLEDFSLQQSEKNKKDRAEFVNSYLKFCDKTLYQRMVSFVEVLYQMQQIMKEANPNLIIRDISESNNKFVERLKTICHQNPDRQIDVEMNYPLSNNKYASLNRILHKNKLFPNIKIIDDFTESNDKFELMEDYRTRSFFLRNFHGIECYAMGYCQRRGQDKNNRNAWFYLRDSGVITPDECQTWQDYTTLRNNIAHNYFTEDLRKQLNEIEDKFAKDFGIMNKKVYDANPIATKIRDKVIEYNHDDGNVTTVDYISHNREVSKRPVRPDRKPQREVYDNGVEFNIKDQDITGIKLPNGVYIDLLKQSIDWGDKTRLYTNAENFNVLQTSKSIIRTDKELKVTSFFEKNRRIPFYKGDSLLVDYRHRLLLDNYGRIKEFKFKNFENNFIKTEFQHIKDGQNLILFDDGTSILFSDKNVAVVHNDKVLSYDNRKEFATTYDHKSILPHQIIKQGNSR